MFEKVGKIFKKRTKTDENPRLIRKRYKLPFRIRVQKFLIWLGIKDQHGFDVISLEDNINELFAHWTKSLVLWTINILFTGSLIYLAILPFWSVQLYLAPFTVFSLGLLYYISIEALKEVRNIIARGVA